MIDTGTVITDLLPALNAATTADLTWWTTAELYGFADEAVKRFARTAGAFADFDALTATVAEVPNPAGCLTVLHVAAAGATLRPATVREIEALSANWTADTGTPQRWIQDVGGLGSFTLYPAPAVPIAIERIYHAEPAAVTAGAPTVSMPSALSAYLYWSMLARARAKEGEAQMPDVVAHAAERIAQLEQAALAYYGPTA